MSRGLKKTNPQTTPTSDNGTPKTKKQLISSIIKKKTKEKFLSESQKEYYDKLIAGYYFISFI